MERSVTYILKQGRTLLFSFVEVLPVFMLIVHMTVYCFYTALSYADPTPELLYHLDNILRHFFEGSFITYILMLVLSAKWKILSKVSYCCLCALWLLNTPYIMFGWDADIYFYAFTSIIYITFVILTVIVLINR